MVYYVKTSGGSGDGLSDANARSYAVYLANPPVSGDTVCFHRNDVFPGGFVPVAGVTYRSYGSGAKPVFSTLVNVTGWAGIGNGLYEKTLDNPPANSLNIVLFNGVLQAIGRYPKAGLGAASYLNIDSLSTTNAAWTNSSGVLTSQGLSSAPNFVGGELVQRTYQWLFDRSRVTAQTGTTVSYDSFQAEDHPTYSYSPIANHGFFFQNHVNCLTTLGDWCYNQTTKKLTMFFGSNDPATYTVQVPTQETLFQITSKSNISFSNLSFTGVNGRMVKYDAATYISFDNCDFSFVGVNGIDVARSSFSNTSHNNVTNCHFNNVLNNPINAVESTNWQINDTHIENNGLIQGMGLSGDGQYISIFKAGANSLVELNHIHTIGYTGIWYTGNSTIVRKNHIHDFCLRKSDGGGIYTYGVTGTNRLIENNIVHDGIGDRYGINIDTASPLTGQVHGIYNDTNSSSITIRNNTCFNNAHSGIWFGSNTNITATGNACFNNTVAQIKGIDGEGNYVGLVIKNNILFAKERLQLVMSFNIANASLYASKFDENFICRPLYEPANVNSNGYPNAPLLIDYHDGGTIETGGKFLSLDKWKALKNQDKNSRKTYAGITDSSTVLFQYNATEFPVTIPLNAFYYDVLKSEYTTEVTLQPFSSKILLPNVPTFSSVIMKGKKLQIV